MRRLVLGIALAVTALMSAQATADDQQIADYIKSRLQVEQTRGNLRGFNVDMRVDNGTVWFKGQVSNSAQEKLILRAAQQAGHLGVVQVVDDIEVEMAGATVADYRATSAQQPQYQLSGYQQQPTSAMQSAGYRVAARQDVFGGDVGQILGGSGTSQVIGGSGTSTPLPFANSSVPGPLPGIPIESYGAPVESYGTPSYGPSYPSSTPLSAGPSAAPGGAPNLPGYAWPGYAASPNYGAVSYPKQYSPSAWPYIGPFYPYPQVPLGWRKVTLEWDDGWWMLDFNDK